jgi:hypothetical protein
MPGKIKKLCDGPVSVEGLEEDPENWFKSKGLPYTPGDENLLYGNDEQGVFKIDPVYDKD